MTGCWTRALLIKGKRFYPWHARNDSEDNSKTLLFSATCPHWVCNVAKKYMQSTFEQMDLIGKKMQKTAITVEPLAVQYHRGGGQQLLETVVFKGALPYFVK